MTDAPKVLTERVGHVGVITINRPEVFNCVDDDVSAGIEAALDEFEADEGIWVIVFTGAGEKAFCSGLDLKAFARAGKDSKVFTAKGGFAGVTHRKLTKPTIAAVNGVALGGGCEIALACDLVVAADHARFGLPEVKVGLIAAAGGIVRLPQRIPRAVALEMGMTGEPIDAPRALAVGLVNRVAERGKTLEEAISLARSICAASPVAVRQTREVMLASGQVGTEEAWEMNKAANRAVLKSEDMKEGQRAFAEKRPPEWKNR
ncbi:MAG TPA: crotonase/enoyl-CoA hydratase family protein [Acidimicrobiia bacterium]|nr:crotonase/enoyl-CoA hydratase family protein [Acidimicrobiia bacterium]